MSNNDVQVKGPDIFMELTDENMDHFRAAVMNSQPAEKKKRALAKTSPRKKRRLKKAHEVNEEDGEEVQAQGDDAAVQDQDEHQQAET